MAMRMEQRPFYAKGQLEQVNGQRPFVSTPGAVQPSASVGSLASLGHSYSELSLGSVRPELRSSHSSFSVVPLPKHSRALVYRAPTRPARPTAPRRARERSPFVADAPLPLLRLRSAPNLMASFPHERGLFRGLGPDDAAAERERALTYAVWCEELKRHQATRMLKAAQSSRPPWCPSVRTDDGRTVEQRWGRGR